MTPAPPIAMLAELTHRCPLSCPYCSNPLELDRRSDELDTATWLRVFREAAELGVLHLHLSGGEPGARQDLAELVAGAARAGLYSNLITSGIGLSKARLAALAEAGLDHVQLSVQDSDRARGDRVAGLAGAQSRKWAFARSVVEKGLPLTVNLVLHRGNLDAIRPVVEEALAVGARRIELAHTQYYGWALRNRAALLPTREQAGAASGLVARLVDEFRGRIVIDYVPPDLHAVFPKPCMNGWGSRSLNVAPGGFVLPCHAAQSIPRLAFWHVRAHPLAEIWRRSPGFQAFRGTDWMREPCRSCARRELDHGGCRCQAMLLTGDPRNTDPVCSLSPHRGLVDAALREERQEEFTVRA